MFSPSNVIESCFEAQCSCFCLDYCQRLFVCSLEYFFSIWYIEALCFRQQYFSGLNCDGISAFKAAKYLFLKPRCICIQSRGVSVFKAEKCLSVRRKIYFLALEWADFKWFFFFILQHLSCVNNNQLDKIVKTINFPIRW